MGVKIKTLLEILTMGLLGATIMIGLKILSPNYGEYVFWSVFLTFYIYFAYTYKIALNELQEFYKSLNKDDKTGKL